MPEILKVQVQAETKTAEDALRRAQQLADSLGKKQATIKIKAEGLDGLARQIKVVENETAKLAMSADTFRALSSGAITAKQAMEDMGTRVNRVNTEMQSFIDHATGVERETSQITAKTSMFGKVSGDTFNSYTSGAITGEQATQTLSKGVKTLGSETQKTSGIFDTLTKRFTAANIVSSLITAAFSKMRQAIREAVSEMKEMDKELTTIKMVSGASDSYINQLTNQAFAGARANGRSVTDYLSAAEMFTRAGYRDNIDQLSQLALMTQNIGGVEEDVAGKFLLAADAAWKLNGSYDALMGVLDGVSSVADQNATDLGKIAEGITVAGSAFANAGESAQTFTAMLGVTTASTQRSGSEMARVLRTILFRVRQVKAELDDGEIISADDISNAAKALDKVGISVMDDTGKLKSMSEILGELNEKWKTWDKKDWRKSYLQNFLAGNRNGNVLYALMDNWGAYEKMLQQYEESSGTALEKNAKYTESWEAATNKLNTAWTNVVSSITDDGGFIQTTTSLLGDFLNWVATQDREHKKSVDEIRERTKSEAYVEHPEWRTDEENLEYARKAAEKYQKQGEKLTKAIKGETDALVDYSDAADGATDSTDDLSDASEEATNTFERQRKKISEVAKAIKEEKNDAVDSLADIYKSAMEAAQSGYYGSNAFQQGGSLFFSKTNLNIIRNGGKLDAQEYLEAYFKEIESGDYADAAANFVGKITHGTNEIKDANGEILASVKDVGEGYEWVFDKGSMSMDDYLTSLEKSTGIASTFWVSMMDSLGLYSDELSEWASQPETPKKVEVDTDDATKQVNNLKTLLGSIEDREVRINVVTAYYTAGGGSTGQHAAETQAKIDLTRGTNSYAWSGAGSASVDKFIPGKAGGKRDNYSGIALVNDEFPANGSKPELIISKSNGTAYIANGGRPALVSLASDDIVLTANETKNALGIPGFEEGKNGLFTTKVSDGLSKGSSTSFFVPKGKASKGSSGSAASSATSADATDNWNQLKKLIDYMVEEQKGILDQNLKVLDKQLEELEATRKAQKDEDELTEKQLKVDEALLELQKAQNERTVRYYNESTHQWEWMADQGVLAQAEEAYSNALKELKDFLSDLDFNEQKAAIQAQKDALQEAFDAYKEGWDLIVQSIEKPTGDLAALFEELKTNGTEAMQSQADNISSLLSALELGFFSGIGDVTGNANSGIGDVTTAASYGIGDVTGAASSGITEVVNRANSFLESVKQAENNVKAAEAAKSTSSSSGGGGGGGGGTGSTTGSKGSGSTGGNTKSSTLEDAKKGLSTVASLYTATTEAVNHAIGVLTSANTSTIANTDYLKKMDTSGTITTSYKSSNKTINNNGNNTYINGVQVGRDYYNKPFGTVLSTLSLHANSTR